MILGEQARTQVIQLPIPLAQARRNTADTASALPLNGSPVHVHASPGWTSSFCLKPSIVVPRRPQVERFVPIIASIIRNDW